MALPFNLDGLRVRPTMYLVRVDFDSVAAYLQGLNAATHDSLLLGFREWLVPKREGGTNLPWSEIILDLAFPGVADSRAQLKEAADHATAIDCLFGNFEEFWAERSTWTGLHAIYLRFHNWLKRQEWYAPGSADWIDDESGEKTGENKGGG